MARHNLLISGILDKVATSLGVGVSISVAGQLITCSESLRNHVSLNATFVQLGFASDAGIRGIAVGGSSGTSHLLDWSSFGRNRDSRQSVMQD